MKKTIKIILNVLKAAAVLLLTLLLILDITILFQKYVLKYDMPQIFGYSMAIVISGSMSPTINIGDLVIIEIGATYAVGDVITYYESSENSYTTHRVISVNDDGSCQTKGDYNDSADKITVTPDIVFGKVVMVLSGVGTVISFLQQPAGMILAVVTILLVMFLLFLLSKLLSKNNDGDKQ